MSVTEADRPALTLPDRRSNRRPTTQPRNRQPWDLVSNPLGVAGTIIYAAPPVPR